MHVFLPLKNQIQKIKNFFQKNNVTLSKVVTILLGINIFLATLFIAIISLLDTQKLAETPGVSGEMTFSYFKKRPDLLSTSRALVIYDATHKKILLSKNENIRFSPASTAKIMTSLVALDHYAKNDALTYPYPLINADSSKMGLYAGEQISIRNLLYGMMLPSGNDAARLIAVSYPGGEQEFVREMNKKVQELGLQNTEFVDPAGYEDENYSTAYDLALLGAHALENSSLSEIVKTKTITVHDTSGNISHDLKNLNELLSISGVNGVKTGFTNEAEGVLVSSFFHNNTQYIMVVLRSQDRFSDTKELISGIIQDLKNESYSF